jgi:hypothetical protein
MRSLWSFGLAFEVRLCNVAYSTVVTLRTTRLTLQNICILPTECIYEFRMSLGINGDYFPVQNYPL